MKTTKKQRVAAREKTESRERYKNLHELEKQRFLNYVRESAKYWAQQPCKTPLEIAEGTAFSILVALDGEACDCGPYVVRPINDKGREGEDIAGSLHNEMYNIKASKGVGVLHEISTKSMTST